LRNYQLQQLRQHSLYQSHRLWRRVQGGLLSECPSGRNAKNASKNRIQKYPKITQAVGGGPAGVA
jgi:hypothetical protein